MIRRLPAAAVLAVALASTAGAAGAAPPAPTPWTLDDIVALRSVTDPQISPDGTRVAYVVQELASDGNAYQTDIWVADVATGAARRLTSSPANDESPRWSPDGRALAFVSERARPGSAAESEADDSRRQLWLIALDGGEAKPLTSAGGGVSDFAWSHDGTFIAFLSHDAKSDEQKKREKNKDDAWHPEDHYAWNRLWTVNVATGVARQLTSGAFHVSSFAIAPDGRRICVAAQPTPLLPDAFQSDLWVVPATGGAPAPLVRQKGEDVLPSWSPDGRWIAFVSQAGRTQEWWANTSVEIVPAAGGTPVNLTKSFDERIGGLGGNPAPVWSPDGASLTFSSPWHTTQRLFRAYTDGRAVERVTRDAVVDGAPSLDAAGDRMAFLREDSEHPRDVWVWDRGAAQPRRLSDANPQVRSRASFRKDVITWTGAEGRTIEGLLVSPAHPKPGARAPMLLYVHGGPAGTNLVTYTAGNKLYPFPLLLEQGWAILMPNPRGSGGYGEAFRSANLRDWGGKDYEDLMAGVDAVVKLGLVDEHRLAVAGWSYGGFMTSTIVTRTDRFRAAVVGAGVTDMGAMVGTCDIPDFNRSYFQAWPWDDPAVYVDHSALYHAGAVRTPTALVHGAADQRVPTSQGWEFYVALRKRGVPTDLLLLPREPHGPREPRHQRSVLAYQLDWLDRWTLGAAPRGAAAPAGGRAAGAR